MQQKIEMVAQDFFKHFSYPYTSLSVVAREQGYSIQIKTNEVEAYIGSAGKNFDTLEYLLRLIVRRQLDEHIFIKLEVNDYVSEKQEQFENFIRSKIQIVEEKGEDLTLPYYNAYKRKQIHTIVADYGNPDIYTKSFGEGRDRRLSICKRASSLTIDIDGNGI